MKRATWLVLVAATSVGGCATSSTPRCAERLCLALPADTTVAREGARQSFHVPGAEGWIDVQTFAPLRPPPLGSENVARALARRLELASGADQVHTGTSLLGGEEAAMVDARIRHGGQFFRRRVYVVHHLDRWYAVDITAPAERYEVARTQFEPILHAAQWSEGPT